MAKTEIKTESVNIKELDNIVAETAEKAGDIFRVCYLEEGENILIFDEKIKDSLQIHTTGKPNSAGKLHYYYSIRCTAPSGNCFRFYLASLDGVAFVAPYRVVKDDAKYTGKVKAVRLTDEQSGSANIAYRKCTTQVEFLRELKSHVKDGKCRLNVKIIDVGVDENPKANDLVAVERNWDNPDNKEYIFKGVKHLYSISFVD